MPVHQEEQRAGSARWTTPTMLFAGMAIFGSATPFSRLIAHDFAPFVGGLFRVLIGSLILTILATPARHQIADISRQDWLRIGVVAVVGMFGFSTLMLFGMRLAPGR